MELWQQKERQNKYSLQSPSQTTWTGLAIKHQKINLFSGLPIICGNSKAKIV
jgi:hypothetical protein